MTAALPRRGRPGNDLETVLQVAARTFTERGYEGTSMDDLARELGVTKSAIYHHVESKEDLLRMATDRALDGLTAVTTAVADMEGPAIDRLEYLIRSSVELLVAELPFVTLLLRVRGNTPAERRAIARRRAIDRAVAELVAEAEADGDIRADLDTAVTARLLFGLVNSLVEWYQPQRADAGTVANAVCAIAFEGLRH